VELIQRVQFQPLGDARGELYALEGLKNIPFEIKRIYFMRGMHADSPRGFHAHVNLKQVAICVTGRCRMVLDDGKRRESTILDSPSSGLLIGNLVWREMHDFSDDCVLLVVASQYYDESDYIRDYKDFLKRVIHQ